jgi:hypothetical protein
MVAALLSIFAGAAGAQVTEPSGQVAVINGASTDPVTATVGNESLADVAYGTDAVATIVPAGDYDVAFTGGTVDSGVTTTVGDATAQTVVSGYGDDTATAKAYAVDMTPIDAGMAKVTVWNATNATVSITIFGGNPADVLPGDGVASLTVAYGAGVAVDIDGVTIDVATPADSYTDVFAVTDDVNPAIALAIIPSMAALIADLTPETPTTTTTPETTTTTTPETTTTTAPATVPVPDVSGKAEADAQTELEAVGFTVKSEEQSSTDVEAGLVIETNPAAGTEVAPDSTVTMIVSSGPGEIVVPDIVGMTQDEATKAAEAAGLTITFVDDADDPDPDGIIVSQDPAAGATAEAGSEVVAQLAPKLDDAWVILTLNPNRLLTVSGINFQPGSTVDLLVLETDKDAKATVQDDGSWAATADLSGVQNEAELLLVTGTAADGSAYEATFKIPAAGESVDEPTDAVPAEEESSGTPVWVWIILGLLVVGIIALGIKMFGGGDSTDSGTTPPPVAPPTTGSDTPPASGGDAPTTDTPPTTDSN